MQAVCRQRGEHDGAEEHGQHDHPGLHLQPLPFELWRGCAHCISLEYLRSVSALIAVGTLATFGLHLQPFPAELWYICAHCSSCTWISEVFQPSLPSALWSPLAFTSNCSLLNIGRGELSAALSTSVLSICYTWLGFAFSLHLGMHEPDLALCNFQPSPVRRPTWSTEACQCCKGTSPIKALP